MMNKGQLYFLVAPARAGKSTLANKWLKYNIDILPDGKINKRHRPGEIWYYNKVFNTENPRVVVCADHIRLAITGQRFVSEAEGMVHATKEIMVRTYVNNGYDVLLDETNTNINNIKKILREYPDAIPYYIDTPIEVCYQRAKDTNQEDLIEYGVIDRMFGNLQQLISINSPCSTVSIPECVYIAIENIRKTINEKT